MSKRKNFYSDGCEKKFNSVNLEVKSELQRDATGSFCE